MIGPVPRDIKTVKPANQWHKNPPQKIRSPSVVKETTRLVVQGKTDSSISEHTNKKTKKNRGKKTKKITNTATGTGEMFLKGHLILYRTTKNKERRSGQEKQSRQRNWKKGSDHRCGGRC